VHRGIVLAAVLGCVLTVSGCGDAKVLHAGGVSVLVAAPSGDSMAAEFRGELAVVGDCAGAGDAVVIWPHGTKVVRADPLTLDIPGVGHVTVGERFEMGGGFVYESSDATESAPAVFGDKVAIPEGCRGRDLWVAAS